MMNRLLIPVVLLFSFILAGISPVHALSQEDTIKTAYRDMLDREPNELEFEREMSLFLGYDVIKRVLNSVSERDRAITQIYQNALKRNPRPDEVEALKRFGAPNNLIRKSLFESPERKLAIIDAYQGLIARDPRTDELDFYVKTRSPFDKIKNFLNTKEDERIPAIEKAFLDSFGQFPSASQKQHFLDNQSYLSTVGKGSLAKPLAVAKDISVGFDEDQVVLDGKGSFDFSGETLSYTWALNQAPVALELVTLENNKSATPTLKFPQEQGKSVAGKYIVELIVSNSTVSSDPLLVNITVSAVNDFAFYLLNRTNELRAAEGDNAKALVFNPKLVVTAEKYSDYMLANEWFEHADKEGNQVDVRVLQEGYAYTNLGENLGIIISNQDNLALTNAVIDSLFDGWKNSEGHYRNMINNRFEEIGIGFSRGKVGGNTENPYQLYATVVFGKRIK